MLRVAEDPKLVPLADEMMNRTKAGLDEHQSRVLQYDRSYQTYRAQYPFNGEPWQSKLRIPYAMQTIDTALVNIVSGKPRAIVRPRSPQYEMQAKAMQHTLDYFIEKDPNQVSLLGAILNQLTTFQAKDMSKGGSPQGG